MRLAALLLAGCGAVLGGPAATSDLCGPGTIFDAATSLCVLPGRERRAGHTAAAPANPSLSVNCPGADTVSCEGDTVEVDANGQCVPKGNQLSKADQLAAISDALADGLKGFRSKARGVNVAVQQAQVADFGTVADVVGNVSPSIQKLADDTVDFGESRDTQLGKVSAKIGETGEDAVAAIAVEAGKVSDVVSGITGAIDNYIDETAKCTAAGAIGYDSKKKKCVGAPKTEGFKTCYEMYLENQKTGTEHLLRDGIYNIRIKRGIVLGGGNSGSNKKLDICIGECDADSQCGARAGLKCFQRSKGEPIPGCTGTGNSKTWDYCYNPDKAAKENNLFEEKAVWCDFQKRAGESTPGWTLVSKISRYSRRHMLKEAYGFLSEAGPNQQEPWKLSNDDINSIREAGRGLAGAPPSAYKFYCSRIADRNEHRGQNFKGYQYFTRTCNFDANRRVDNYDNRVCHDWAATETMTKYVTGYGDSNDCGLGGHAGGGTLASYGWHYCNRLSSLQSEKSYFINPSSNTGCGHNDGDNRKNQYSGDGELWLK